MMFIKIMIGDSDGEIVCEDGEDNVSDNEAGDSDGRDDNDEDECGQNGEEHTDELVRIILMMKFMMMVTGRWQ